MYVDYNQHNAYGDFGRNIFTPLVTTLQRAVKVITAPVTVVRKVTQGNYKGAFKDSLDMINPIVAVSKVATANPRLINYARATMPTSVLNITNPKLRKQVAIGYAVAAIAAGAAFAAGIGATTSVIVAGDGAVVGAGAAGATGLTATGAATGATALASATKLATQAKQVASVVDIGRSLIKKDKNGNNVEGDVEPQERAGAPGSSPRYETEIKDTPWLIYGGVGAGVLTLMGIAYYLNKSKEVV